MDRAPLQRVAGLSGVPGLLRELGADPMTLAWVFPSGPKTSCPTPSFPSGRHFSLTGNTANVDEVLLCHRPPSDPILFESILRTKVRFDQYQSCVVLARADFKLTKPHAAMLLHRMKPLLMQDAYSLDAVARRLDMHPRTLNRRLLETGSSFVAIRDEVRFRVAQELLALTDLPAGDIASALSFSAHSNFVRAFRRWAGVTPTVWRSGIMSAAAL